MIVIRRYKDSGEWKRINYPRVSLSEPVVNLNPNIEFYTITDNQPVYDEQTEFIRYSDVTFTDDADVDYPHLKVAIQNYTIHDLPSEETIII